ncbi:MAG: hypothetical protein ACLPVO_14700 [Desulfomonilaceae bacterium]|jgi:hypothetical protein|nr:hypothetical protein [Syntrophaceae bacterium]
MLTKHVTLEEALLLLDLEDASKLQEAEEKGLIHPVNRNSKKESFLIQDLVTLKLALAILDMGLAPDRAIRYAEAILGVHSSQTFKKTIAWVDSDTHELFGMFADKQLSRIFIRSLDDNREIEVGAEKPVLFPISKCELNVSRTIRPVITRTHHMVNSKKRQST